MSADDSFGEVMNRLREGTDEAAQVVFQKFARRLIGLARVHLGDRLQGKIDPEDVTQSVFRSFFLRQGQGLFELESWDGLWSLLTVMTIRKCGRWRDRFYAAKRNVRREVAPEESSQDLPEPRKPKLDEAVMLADLVETLLRGLDSRWGLVVSMRLQGHTTAEIADAVGVTERTIHNMLKRLRERLGQLVEEEE